MNQIEGKPPKTKTTLMLPPYPKFYIDQFEELHYGLLILTGQPTAEKPSETLMIGAAMWEEVLSNVQGPEDPMCSVAVNNSVDWRSAAFGRIPLGEIEFAAYKENPT